MAGYPDNQFFNYSKLFRFLNFHINNCGDPFQAKASYYRINTHKFEKEVIDIFAQLFHAPKNNYWGYVTNGGTEGNLYGIYVARELHPEGVVIYSQDTHYSIAKICRLLRVPSLHIKSQPNGEIDYNALQDALAHEKRPPIIVANIGTTMKGAVDEVLKIKEILADLKIQNYYIHCDAAFFGMILPFVHEMESQLFDFRAGVDSIAVSGHKLIGTPMPCGVVLVKNSNAEKINSFIEYIGSSDKTITGSRNGLSPLILWYELKSAKREKLTEIINICLKRASYAIQKFNEKNIKAWRNKNSMIVLFTRPSDTIIRKWQLAVEGDLAHLITLPQVTHRVIDAIVNEVAHESKKPKAKRGRKSR